MTIFQFAFIRSMKKKFTLLTLCTIPIIMIFIAPLWETGEGFGYNFYGIIILYTAFLLVRAIMTDRINKITIRIFAAPVTTYQYLFQNLMGFLILIILQIIVIIGIGSIRYRWSLSDTCLLMIIYILFAANAISFSLAWNSLFRSKEMSDGVFSVVISIMSLLGGVFVPLSLLPGILQKIGMIFPTYWLSTALIEVQNNKNTLKLFLAAGMLILFSVACLIFGSKRRLE